MSDPAPLYTVAAAEQIVKDRFRTWRIPTTAPINIDQVVACLDASVEAMPFIKAKLKVEAFITRIRSGYRRKFMVYVDTEIIDGATNYLRLVLAEEASHLLVDEATVGAVKTFDGTLQIHSNPMWHELERNREMIGRVMLAPFELLRQVLIKEYASCVREHGFLLLPIEIAIAKRLVMPVDQVRLRLRECNGNLNDLLNFSLLSRSEKLRSLYDDDAIVEKKPKSTLEWEQKPLFY